MANPFISRLRPRTVVWILIGLYVLFFALNSIQIHRALETHTADLGQIDLAVWNTSQGRFVQEIKGENLSTRLTDHVEPIWIPISLIFWFWNDVKALLLLQTIALAIGAWPLYLIARRRIRRGDEAYQQRQWARQQRRQKEEGIARAYSPQAGETAEGWGPVALVAIYLLYPGLQAANLTEVHAIPFAVPIILFAFWFIDSAQWGKFAVSVLLLALVKEEAALLAVLLGLYGLLRLWRSPAEQSPSSATPFSLLVVVTGLALLWFYLATFVIVPRFASEVYAVEESTYFLRYGVLGESAGDIIKAAFSRPLQVWDIATTPGRLSYLLGLVLATGGLALVGPEIILLSAPILLANILSTFEAQWSGGLHYTAPLVAYFMVAAAYGLDRMARWIGGDRRRPASTAGRIALIALIIAIGYHLRAGWTPAGANFRWPEVTEHDRQLSKFVDQIPDEAAVATTTALTPHLSHRQYIYKLPNLGEAQWVLADVSGTTDMHAASLQEQLRVLLNEGWGVVDAGDGYLLLAASRDNPIIPDDFYDFARVDEASIEVDQRMEVEWPGGTTYLGYSLEDRPQWGLTRITHFIRAGDQPLNPYFFVAAVDGEITDDLIVRPPAALQWYPPQRWQPGEVLAFSSAWFLPAIWRPAVAFAPSETAIRPSAARDAAQRIEPEDVAGSLTWEVYDSALWLQPWQRPTPGLPLSPLPADTSDTGSEKEAPTSAGIDLWLQTASPPVRPGQDATFRLGWMLAQELDKPHTIFVHLLDGDGKRVAQEDTLPHHFYPLPLTAWSPDETVYTGHTVTVPDTLPAGRYDILVGLYDPETGERLSIDAGGAATNALVVGDLRVRRGDGYVATLGQ